MYDYHKILFGYSEFIKDTDIKKIEIVDDNVIMSSREQGIKIICIKDDERIPPIECLNFDYYEENDSKMIYNFIEDNFIVFDIGANIGWYSIGIAKYRKNVKVYSFEPIPKTYDNLKSNVKLNDLHNIEIFNYGFYNEDKNLTFYYYPEGSGNASSVILTENKDFSKIQCKVITLDGFVKNNNIPKIDFIKCDVEGAELFVFEGAIRTIELFKPIVFTEMLRKWSSKFNYHPNKIITFFNEKGYLCFVSNEKELQEIKKIDENTLETNFFFLHKKKHSSQILQYSSCK